MQNIWTKISHFLPNETRQYGIEICQALRWIHKNRMVYRDLKPSNVIITNSGHAVLIDPGTIRMYKAIQSKDTVIIGTPGYAAPEQFGFHQTDQRADIYALGVLLNNMLTCAMPNEQLTTHKKFQKIIRRCLSIAAKNRYQSCLIVQRELERIVSEHSTRDIRFFRRIPGFRSARLSHMIPASFFLFVGNFNVSLFCYYLCLLTGHHKPSYSRYDGIENQLISMKNVLIFFKEIFQCKISYFLLG